MAGSSLFALLDDIVTLLDDVAAMTKIAAKKTAGVLGDDLALNAEQVTGFAAERELPVVWAVAKGSLLNKAILVPAALAISWVAPWAVTPLLMFGGLFLCFEGVEKLAHKFLADEAEEAAHRAELGAALTDESVDLLALEKTRVRGAIRTDFILSAEIIVICLGTVANEDFVRQLGVLITVALVITAVVYGLVAAIVKLDDIGVHLLGRSSRLAKSVGRGLLRGAPLLMRALSVLGMVAMFLVGGGILTHGFSWIGHRIEGVAESVGDVPAVGTILEGGVSLLLNGGFGVLAGAVAVVVVESIKHLRKRVATAS